MIQKALYSCGKEFVWGAYKKSELLAKEAEEYLSKNISKSTTFSFGTLKPTKPTFSFETSSAVENATREMTGATQIAEQNRVLVTNHNFSFCSPIKHSSKVPQEIKVTHPIKFGKSSGQTSEIYKLLSGYNPNIEAAENLFFRETGAKLHIGNPHSLTDVNFGFTEGLHNLMNWYKEGIMPPDIKHIVIGHGSGSSEMGSWVFWNNGPKGSVFDYISKTVPKGEKVLVLTCEEGQNTIARPGIGAHVVTNLTYASNPGKIVKSGESKIIGHFYSPTKTNNGATYY